MTELTPYHPAADDWERSKELAKIIDKTEFVPAGLRGRPAAVLAALLTGQELGIGKMQALRSIHVVDGKPGYSAEFMAGMVRRAGHKLRVLERTPERVRVQGVRSDDPEYPMEVTYTIEEAVQAGLVELRDGRPHARDSKGRAKPWERYTVRMLLKRAMTALCTELFSDVFIGMALDGDDDADGAGPTTVAEFEHGALVPNAHLAPDGSVIDGDTGEVLAGPRDIEDSDEQDPATDGEQSPAPSVAAFPASMRAAQQEASAVRRRAQTEALRQREGQTSGAGEREPAKSDGEGAGIDRDDPAPDSPSPVGHDAVSSGPPATATASTTVGHLARGLEMDPNDAVRRLASHPYFKGVTVSAKTPVPGERISALRAFLTEGEEPT